MSEQSYTATYLVDQTPDEVFAAVTDTRGWWSQQIEGTTDVLGGEFTYHYRDVHRGTMRIEEFVPGEKVVWHVLDNHFAFVQDKTEWIDTRIVFEITREGDQTRLRFTHLGLVPSYECYDVCTNAWGGYITDSLKSRITTGTGKPNNDERNAQALAQRA